jgi:uncharacterized protein (DUF2062 family)
MPKKFIKRYMPDHRTVREHKHLQFLGKFLHEPNLWHLNRRSASGAMAVGLFCAFIPMPFQMVPAAALAILFRVNLPISIALVWITNPVTMPPITYFCYKVGAWVLGTPPQVWTFEPSLAWVQQSMGTLLQPFLLGSFLVASAASVTGYLLVRGLWRLSVVRHDQRKKYERRKRQRESKERTE